MVSGFSEGLHSTERFNVTVYSTNGNVETFKNVKVFKMLTVDGNITDYVIVNGVHTDSFPVAQVWRISTTFVGRG